MIIDIGPEKFHHDKLINFLQKSKSENKNYKVLDVGGACCGRFWKYTDVIFDWKSPLCHVDDKNNPYHQYGTKHIKGNALKQDDWNKLIEYTKINGKFDFVLCTHTIEDFYDPTILLEMLPKVASAGYISVPSKESEIRKGYHNDNPYFKGCGHHFWIFTIYNNKLVGLPKMNWIETFSDQDLYKVDPRLGGSGATHTPFKKQELSIYWENTFDYCLLLPVSAGDLPDEFSTNNPDIYEVYKQHKSPWNVWKHILNESM